MPFSRSLALPLVFLGTLVGCGGGWTTPASENASAGGSGGNGAGGAGGTAAAPEPVPVYPPDPAGLHVVGNQILDGAGQVVILRGVNRSGSEYRCVQGSTVFDGPSDDASIQVMTQWHINAVRVLLNESCWLDVTGSNAPAWGENYKSAIKNYVNLLHKYKLTPILDLHWASAGTIPASKLQPMPDADHSAAFWTDVAQTFLDDTGVVFELFNEPFPGGNRDNPAAWTCWRDGCVANTFQPAQGTATTFQAIGMQALVTAVRSTGATQLILLGGVQYSNALSQWQAFKPTDPAENLAVAWHLYNYNACKDATCWESVLTGTTALGAQFPIVATEIGENDCANTFINPLMDELDAHTTGYLAWSWNVSGACVPAVARTATTPAVAGNPYTMITDFVTGTPNGDYALGFRDRLLSINP